MKEIISTNKEEQDIMNFTVKETIPNRYILGYEDESDIEYYDEDNIDNSILHNPFIFDNITDLLTYVLGEYLREDGQVKRSVDNVLNIMFNTFLDELIEPVPFYDIQPNMNDNLENIKMMTSFIKSSAKELYNKEK